MLGVLSKDDLQRLLAQARALADLADREYERERDETIERILEKNPSLSHGEAFDIWNEIRGEQALAEHHAKRIPERMIEDINPPGE